MKSMHERLPRFIANLKHLDAQGQHDAFVNEVLEAHGRFDAPAGDRSHLWEIELHGIKASGATDEEAIANWKRLAVKNYRGLDVEDDGFVTAHPALTEDGQPS